MKNLRILLLSMAGCAFLISAPLAAQHGHSPQTNSSVKIGVVNTKK